MGLIAAIGVGPVAIDTSIFIYSIEQHPRYLLAILQLETFVLSG